MTLTDRKRLSRDLSGPAASVLMALILAQRPLTASEIASDWCGQSRPTVQDGLNRLAEYGLATNWGKHEGWTVNLHQLALWQGHSGTLLEEGTIGSPPPSARVELAPPRQQPTGRLTTASDKSGCEAYAHLAQPVTAVADPVTNPVDNSVDNSPEEVPKMPENEQLDDNNCKNFTILPINRINLINNSDPSENSIKFDSELTAVCQILTIHNGTRQKLVEAAADPATLLGWYLWALTQGDWMTSATGWAIKCTVNPRQQLKSGWHDLAQWLLAPPLPLADLRLTLSRSPLIDALDINRAAWQSAEVEIPTAVASHLFQLHKAGQLSHTLELISKEESR